MINILNFDFESELKNFEKIFVLVSGGIDSTYLYEVCMSIFPEKTYPVNCFNPFETSNTLKQICSNENFISVKPKRKLDYAKIMRESFLNIERAKESVQNKRYSKKSFFKCCYHIKHKAFLQHIEFKEPNTVVLSGIKPKDSVNRGFWLQSLRSGISYCKNTEPSKSFFHRLKTGQLYCYPYRDYFNFELPSKIILELRRKYPDLSKSACEICPVLVLFRDKVKTDIDKNRLRKSESFYENSLKWLHQKEEEFQRVLLELDKRKKFRNL